MNISFRKHKFSWTTNKHGRKMILWFLISPQCHDLWPHFMNGSGDPARQLIMYFNVEMIPRGYYMCGLMSAKNCHAKGSELTQRIHSQLRWQQSSWMLVDRRLQKNSTVCSMFLQQNKSIFYWVPGSTAQWQCAQLRTSTCQQEIVRGRNFHG